MSERSYHLSWLIRLQTICWYLFFVTFGCLTVLHFVWPSVARQLDPWMLSIIGLAAIARLLLVAELFRLIKQYRYWILGYILILLLISTVFVKRFLP